MKAFKFNDEIFYILLTVKMFSLKAVLLTKGKVDENKLSFAFFVAIKGKNKNVERKEMKMVC